MLGHRAEGLERICSGPDGTPDFGSPGASDAVCASAREAVTSGGGFSLGEDSSRQDAVASVCGRFLEGQAPALTYFLTPTIALSWPILKGLESYSPGLLGTSYPGDG